MAEITFYTHIADRQQFACRLVQRVLGEAIPLLVLLEDATEVAQLSEQLWHFSDNSFLAHHLWHSGSLIPQNSPVILTDGFDDDEADRLPETILNLSDTLCTHQHFSRVLEIVGADETALNAARHRFVAYRAAGCVLTHHNMQGKAS